MRIVAGGARRPLVHYVETVAPVLAEAVDSAETLVAENAVPAMAFVAERIVAGALGCITIQQALALEDWGKGRAMRAIGAGAAGLESLVVVVAIRAFHLAGGGPRGDQARHIRILARAFDRMKRLITQIELEPFVGVGELPSHSSRAEIKTLRMAAEAELVLTRGFDDDTDRIDAFESSDQLGGVPHTGDAFPGRVRIMAIATSCVARAVDWIFVRVVHV